MSQLWMVFWQSLRQRVWRQFCLCVMAWSTAKHLKNKKNPKVTKPNTEPWVQVKPRDLAAHYTLRTWHWQAQSVSAHPWDLGGRTADLILPALVEMGPSSMYHRDGTLANTPGSRTLSANGSCRGHSYRLHHVPRRHTMENATLLLTIQKYSKYLVAKQDWQN
jgi:hypothetical protein